MERGPQKQVSVTAVFLTLSVHAYSSVYMHVCFASMHAVPKHTRIQYVFMQMCTAVCMCRGALQVVCYRQVNILLNLQGYVQTGSTYSIFFGTTPVEADCLDQVQAERKHQINRCLEIKIKLKHFGLKSDLNHNAQLGRCRLN